MKPREPIKIAVLPGDGIGVEVTYAAIPIFATLNIPVQLSYGDIGWECWKEEGTGIPNKTWELIHSTDTILLGSVTSKPQREAKKELSPTIRKNNPDYVSPIIQLRQNLDLYANIRPCFSVKTEKKSFHFCIIRENTEGLYAGFDYSPLPKPIHQFITKTPRWQATSAKDLSCAFRLQSKLGLQRLFDFAFQYAIKIGMNRVTFADKPNVLRQSGEFARAIFETSAKKYSEIQADILNVDAVALWLITKPEQFGIIVAENMFGDILSDIGAGVMGGLGLAPSANIGFNRSYFEPVHGSGPSVKANCANPSAMFLTISMMLTHFGYQNQARKILNAVKQVINEGQFVTYDLGGRATTKDMASAIIELCSEEKPAQVVAKSIKKQSNEHQVMKGLIQKLKQFNSAEISDALDACGIEGCLLNIKPLVPGMKIAGPAYTIQYLKREKKEVDFQNAGNYIDNIPEESVIVIDNGGQIDCTVWGDILTQTAVRNNLAGTIVHGAVRDLESILLSHYPVFCTAVSMRSGKNRVYKANEQCPVTMNGVIINPDDIIFGDANGVLVIPKLVLPNLLSKVQNIQLTENRIKKAIESGSSLEQARQEYQYDRPWLGVDGKKKPGQ